MCIKAICKQKLHVQKKYKLYLLYQLACSLLNDIKIVKNRSKMNNKIKYLHASILYNISYIHSI